MGWRQCVHPDDACRVSDSMSSTGSSVFMDCPHQILSLSCITKCCVVEMLSDTSFTVVSACTASYVGLSMAAPLLCPASDHNPNAPSTAAAAAAAAAAAGVSQGASIGLGAVGHQQPVPLLQTLQVIVRLQRYVVWPHLAAGGYVVSHVASPSACCINVHCARLPIKCLAQFCPSMLLVNRSHLCRALSVCLLLFCACVCICRVWATETRVWPAVCPRSLASPWAPGAINAVV
jgi:hypothetical protein